MPIKRVTYGLIFGIWAGPMLAQDQPLSIIDWVHRQPENPAIVTTPLPDVTLEQVRPSALPSSVAVTTLRDQTPRRLGLAPSSVTGLSDMLWRGSDPKKVSTLLQSLPDIRLPAAQALLFRTLLTESFGPGDDAANEDMFTLARVEILTRFGALDPAIALIDQAGVTRDAAHFTAFIDLALLTGAEDTACTLLVAKPHLAPTMGHRIFCDLRAGDWPTAALIFDTGRALGLLPKAQENLLARFLDPDLFEDTPPLVPPAQITPLLFRLHDSIGEPLPTRSLPRAYAVADLRDLVGWKAQLEAAERLARAGTLPDNQLLGLYTDRRPAASGGIWDRVAAIQRFDTAAARGDVDKMIATLPAAWAQMQSAGLEVPFANLFAQQVTTIPLEGTGQAGRIALTLQLLSPDYARAAILPGVDPLVRAIVLGEPPRGAGQSARHEAVAAAFAAATDGSDITRKTAQNLTGETILKTIALMDAGVQGDLPALTQSLINLRALGLEETARRAALQALLLERLS